MGLFARIFASPEAIMHTVDTVAQGFDKLVYTKEEQADDAAKRRDKELEQISAARGMVIEWMKSTSGQNLARRWLTVVITSVWLSLYGGAAVFATTSVFLEGKHADRTLAASGMLAGYANSLGDIVLIIILFYFAAPHMGQVIDTLLQRFGIRPTGGAMPNSQPHNAPTG